MGSNFIDKMMDIFGMGDDSEKERDGETYTEEEEPEQLEVFSNNKKGKVVSIHSNLNMKVVILEPSEYEEITTICDGLKNRKIVITNLQKLAVLFK
jgi:cell division inhibitor SepF